MPGRQDFQTVSHNLLSLGIDQRSAQSNVKPGYAEDMRNMDTNSTGFVTKRKGYQGYKGALPIRPESFEVSGSNGNFNFNTDINLFLTSSTPIVVYGEILESGGADTISASGTTVTGTGTSFLTDLAVGSTLIASNGESQVVTAIASDTSLTTGAAFSSAVSGLTFTYRTTREYYWNQFENDSRKTVAAGATPTYTIAHGAGTKQVAAGVVYTPNANDLDNFTIIPDDLVITTTSALTVTIDNSTSTDSKDIYVLTENTAASDVVTYRSTVSQAIVGGTATISIPAATHGLPNLHVLPFIYAEKSAGEYTQIIPDSFTIDASGSAVIVIDDAGVTVGGGATFEGQVVFIDVPGTRALEASYTSGDGRTISFSGVTDQFNFYALYTQEAGGDQIQAIPDSVFYDASAQTLTATFDIDTSRNIKLVYTDAAVKSNVITVDLTDYPNLTNDTALSVSLWGIPHAEIVYADDVTKGSWVNSLEEYSSQGSNKLVSGIGGGLCEEIGSGQGVTLPSFFSNIRRRTDASKTIGPFFGTIENKDRGIDGSGVTGNCVNVAGIVNNGDGTANLELAMGARYGSLTDLVTNVSLIGNDRVTIIGAGVADYNGTFDISAVSDAATYVLATSVGLQTATINSSTEVVFTFDTNGNAASFHSTYLQDGYVWAWKDGSDQVFAMTVLDSTLLDPVAGTTITVNLGTSISLSGPNSSFDGGSTTTFTTEKITMEATGTTNTITITVPSLASYVPNDPDTGADISINTDSLIMSAQNEAAVNADLPFLVGDTIVSTLFAVEPSVIGLDSAFGSTRTLYLDNMAQNVLVPAAASLNARRTSNVQPLTSIANFVKGDMINVSGYTRQFQILSIDITAETLTLDESIAVSDDPSNRTTFTVDGRWRFIEAPAFNARPIQYFDQKGVNNQDRLRGVSINDSIFYSNYDDDIMKYDGQSLYRAGFINWQPRVHSWVDNSQEGIPVIQHQYIKAEATGNLLRFATLPDLDGVDTIYFVGDDGANTTATADVRIESVDYTNNTVTLNATDLTLVNSSTRGHIAIPQQVAYYFKLQMIDRNNNLIASAVTDYQECIINLNESGKITHKLTGLPKFDVYDYDRIDILMFRTRIAKTASPTFYQVKRVPIDFELANANQSIIITDTVPNEALSPIPDDTVSVALKGAELPISTEQPPRAKYLETVDSRLVMGNIKGYSKADVTLVSDGGITEDNVLGNAIATVADDNNSLSFEFFDLTDGTTSLNTTNNIDVASIDFTSSTTQFAVTVNGDIGYDLTGKWIQLSSFYMDANGTTLYSSTGRTRVSSLGRVVGWWKVTGHNQTGNDVLTIEYTHGISSDYTFGGTNNPIYLTFPDNGSSNVPVLAIPYAITNTQRIVSDIVYDDTTTALEFTDAITRGVRDLKQAFNRVMTQESSPWAFALSGSTEGNGRIVFESALPGRTLTVTITNTDSTDLDIFINNIKRLSGAAVNGVTELLPSRLVISSPNFPEMFDNPFGNTAADSDSILDVNTDDGQEITGMATFFADSTSASGQLQSTLIVFKNQSVYAVDVATRSLQKLESMNQGCTVPDSIAQTQGGIMFANQSGLYMVDRRLQVTYVGKWLERYWRDTVSSTTVETYGYGYTDSVNRKYKISVPLGTSIQNSEMAVLDYISDDPASAGAWSIYDNFAANIWVNTNTNSFFGNYTGRVLGLRQADNTTDYRDDASAITATYTHGAQSFGDTGTRATLNRVVTHFQADTSLTSVDLSIATDMSTTFTSTDTISFTGTNPKVRSVSSSLPERHALFFQLKYTHSTIDESFVLAGIDYKVRVLDELGIPQARETT